jgi:hypothetical protein
MRQPLIAFALAIVALATGAPAQAPAPTAPAARGPDARAPDARAFVPAVFFGEVFLDMKTLRDQEVLDGLSSSLFGPVLKEVAGNLGFDLQELDQVRIYLPKPHEQTPVIITDDGKPVLPPREAVSSVLQGSDKVRLPAKTGENFAAEKIAGHDVLLQGARWYGDDPDVWVSPRPGLLVIGARHDVQPVLEGKGKPGVPPGEFLSLTSGKGIVAHVVVQLAPSMLQDIVRELPQGTVCDEDPPRFVAVRLRSEPPANAGDDPTFVLEATVRCNQAGKGPAALLAAAKQGIEAGKHHPQLGALKALWSKLEVAVDGCDVVARLPLGRAREAVNSIGMFAAPLWTMRRAEAAAVEARAVATPATEEKPAGGGR